MALDKAVFKDPPAEHRGAPFLSLNCDLRDHERLEHAIESLREMGMGGAHLHVRSGLRTSYLSDDFLEAIHVLHEHATRRGMLTYLYDEDTWPSGFAGGMVTQDREFRQQWLHLTPESPALTPDRKLLAAYNVEFTAQGTLKRAERLAPANGQAQSWWAWVQRGTDSDRYNGQSYVDVLNPAAIRAFIDCTHETYRKAFGGEFPNDVRAIFTDEPNMAGYHPLASSNDVRGWRAPWTSDLQDSFREAWQEELLNVLAEICWPLASGPSAWRWRFWEHLTERFARAFSDQLGSWCAEAGIALTGHMLNEPTLSSQMAVGECMRHYRSFHIPGVDMLCDSYEPTTVKQAVSVARQTGRASVMSELYGVTNWDFPFRGHKCQGDWQAALGITLRVHHLTWLSMAGDAKRDYPASIGPQSPWFKEYPLIENHFARVNAALAKGRPVVRIAVLHPIESFWLHQGVNELEGVQATAIDEQFRALTDWLLEAQLDFDFVAESLLPKQWSPRKDGRFQVGQMIYDAVILPTLTTVRTTTLEALASCAAGRVMVVGSQPTRVDGTPAEQQVLQRLGNALVVPNLRAKLLATCEKWREIAVRSDEAEMEPRVLYQLREHDDGERVLFCAHRLQHAEHSAPWERPARSARIHIRGRWRVSELDTQEGTERPCAQHHDDHGTVVPWQLEAHSHRLLRLSPDEAAVEVPHEPLAWQSRGDCPEPLEVTLEEDNVLLLDRASWRLNEGDWQPPCELIHLAQKLRERFQWPSWRQPYSIVDAGSKQQLELSFEFQTSTPLDGLRLVCERVADAEVLLDGQHLSTQKQGWWVDRELPTVPLPELSPGRHSLQVTLPLDARHPHVEWCYLLGNFGVQLQGASALVVAAGDNLKWGDTTKQGLPFYGGNLSYTCRMRAPEAGHYTLRCRDFGGPLLRISCDGRDCGPLAFAPYRAELGELADGEHELKIVAYGNRFNTFGALHNATPGWRWWGPQSWLTHGADWNDIWQLRPAGILRAPILEFRPR